MPDNNLADQEFVRDIDTECSPLATRSGLPLSHQMMYLKCKVKVKVTLVQALRLCTGRTAYRGSRGIALLFHDHGTRRG